MQANIENMQNDEHDGNRNLNLQPSHQRAKKCEAPGNYLIVNNFCRQ